MEKMLYRAELDVQTFEAPAATTSATSDWRHQLPVLTGRQVRLRELRASDAPSLFALLTTEEVARAFARAEAIVPETAPAKAEVARVTPPAQEKTIEEEDPIVRMGVGANVVCELLIRACRVASAILVSSEIVQVRLAADPAE